METDELMIVESSSSLHLTVSKEEPAPELSKLSSSSSSSDEDESAKEHGDSRKNVETTQLESDSSIRKKDNSNGLMGSGVSKETLPEQSQCSTPVQECYSENDVPNENGDAMTEEEPSKTEPKLEILNSEEQVDGSLYIEVKDDCLGDPEEDTSAKIQRLARKAGIIVGGGTMTAVGTVMLFLPCPTPSIYLMIGGMAIMSKEIPAAQRQLDTTREGLQGWVERAEKEFADGVRQITVVVDNGGPKNKDVSEEKEEEDREEKEEKKEKPTPTAITSTQVVHQRRNPVKRHFVKSCRNVILPLLNKVCTPQEMLQQGVLEENPSTEVSNGIPEPLKTPTKSPRSDLDSEEGKENASPKSSPFARWAKYRENRREELLKEEEQREREAMLARINEANLKKIQEESNSKVVQENQDEEEEEDDEIPVLSESMQRLLSHSESAVIGV